MNKDEIALRVTIVTGDKNSSLPRCLLKEQPVVLVNFGRQLPRLQDVIPLTPQRLRDFRGDHDVHHQPRKLKSFFPQFPRPLPSVHSPDTSSRFPPSPCQSLPCG